MLSIEKLIARSYNDAPSVVRDFMAIRAGIKMPHAPMALARELAESHIRPKDLIEPLAKAKALNSNDFAQITTRLVNVVASDFPEPEHRKLAMFLNAVDYREQTVIAGIEDVAPDSTIDESGEIPTAHLYNLPLEKTAIKRRASRVIISYEAIINRTDWISTVPPGTLQSVYRDEGADLFALLEGNPIMEDGQPVFSSDNSITGTSFGDLLTCFRSQKVRGGQRVLGAEPAYLVTPATQELSMRKSLKEADLNGVIEVISRADVTNSYLIADKSMSPTIFRLGLSDKPYIDVEPVPRGSGDIAVTSGHSYAFMIGSRLGLCRMVPA